MINWLINRFATGRRWFLIQNADKTPYLLRILLRGRLPREPDYLGRSDYLHWVISEDKDRDLHNHPWDTGFSIILSGGYIEERELPDGTLEVRRLWPFWLNPFRCVNRLGPRQFHRIRTLRGTQTWTWFRCGKKKWAWGFVDHRTRHWTEQSEYLRRKGYDAEPDNDPLPPWLVKCGYCEHLLVPPVIMVPNRAYEYHGTLYQPPEIPLCGACKDSGLTMEQIWDKDHADRTVAILRRETRVRDTDG